MAWLCLQKGNQARCPKPVGGANRFWASLQFVRVHEQHTHTQILGHTDTHNAYEANKQANKQINKQESRFSFPVSLWKSLSHPNTDTHTHKHSLPHRKPSFVQVKKTGCLFIIPFISAGNGHVHERHLNKSRGA